MTKHRVRGYWLRKMREARLRAGRLEETLKQKREKKMRKRIFFRGRWLEESRRPRARRLRESFPEFYADYGEEDGRLYEDPYTIYPLPEINRRLSEWSRSHEGGILMYDYDDELFSLLEEKIQQLHRNRFGVESEGHLSYDESDRELKLILRLNMFEIVADKAGLSLEEYHEGMLEIVEDLQDWFVSSFDYDPESKAVTYLGKTLYEIDWLRRQGKKMI